MRRRRCKDPICPANQSPPRTSSKREKKSKNRATVPRGRTTTDCRNKMCQVSRSTVESSTSTPRPRARSRESVRSRRSRSISCKSRRTGCHCRRIREARKRSTSPRQKKPIRSRKTLSRKKQTALCVCVRGSSSQDLKRNCKRPSACAILSKYDDCCCTQNRKGRSKRDGNSNSGRGKPTRQCHCVPPVSKLGSISSTRSMLERGLSNLRKKLEKLKFSLPRRRRCEVCPAQRYCSRRRQGNPPRNRDRDRDRNRNKTERRKMKFHK